jgi:hypothetical protein
MPDSQTRAVFVARSYRVIKTTQIVFLCLRQMHYALPLFYADRVDGVLHEDPVGSAPDPECPAKNKENRNEKELDHSHSLAYSPGNALHRIAGHS